MLEEEPASPVILASKLSQPLGTVAYHVRTLYDLGLLELVRTRQRRGATEHYYRSVSHPSLSDDTWERLDGVSKQRLLTAQLIRAHEYATRSAAAGGFDRSDSAFATKTLQLDAQGWEELAAEAASWLDRADAIAQAAAARLAAEPESQVDVGLNLQVFEGVPFSAALPGSGENENEKAGRGGGSSSAVPRRSNRPARRQGSIRAR